MEPEQGISMTDEAVRPLPRLKERLESLCAEMIDRGILYSEARERFDRCFVSEVVRRCGGNLVRAAARLEIHRNTLSKRLKSSSRE